jgi:hypothetical protein
MIVQQRTSACSKLLTAFAMCPAPQDVCGHRRQQLRIVRCAKLNIVRQNPCCGDFWKVGTIQQGMMLQPWTCLLAPGQLCTGSTVQDCQWAVFAALVLISLLLLLFLLCSALGLFGVIIGIIMSGAVKWVD